MISPLWMVNSALAVISLIVLVFIMLTQESIPTRTSIKPDPAALQRKKDSSKIVDITRIYQNDLFGTYITPQPPQPEELPRVLPLPEPPLLKPVSTAAPPKAEFLPPLAVTLKGIILATHDKDTRAIIAETQTGQEKLYQIGDIVEDAELIHISGSKVIFIRSNGQQETVFLTPKEAEADPIYTLNNPWNLVVRKINDTTYRIDPKALLERITSLAQFLDMLDMTTAFQNGLSIGCRIGTLSPQSIGVALGFKDNDIILAVNGIAPTTTASRVTIYESIKNMSLNGTVAVVVLRNNAEQTITFTLEQFEQHKEQEPFIPGTPLPTPLLKTSRNERVMNLLSQDAESNSSVQQIKKQDRMAMLRQGGRGSVIQRTPDER